MGELRDTWKELLNRFDPDLPPRREWRAQREDSPAQAIVASLDRGLGRPERVLLSGTIGIGKSTELLRIAEARALKGDEFVIVLDLVRHFRKVVGDLEALQNVDSWEVCFLVGAALIRAARENLGYDFPPPQLTELGQAWTALARASQPPETPPPTIDLLAVVRTLSLMASGAAAPAGAGIAGGLHALSEIAAAGKWYLPFGRRGTKPLEDQDELMRTLVDKVNQLLATFQPYNRRVLFVIDGLDRIVDGDRAKALFLHSQMIARLDCCLVVCAPFALRSDMAAAEVRGFRLRTLHNAPVLDPKQPASHGQGVEFLRQVYHCRVRDLAAESLVSSDELGRLAYYSGGRLRDFVRSIGMLAERGFDDNAATATSTHVDEVIREARLLKETGLNRGHIDLLAAVARDPEHRLPHGPLARELLTWGRLLPYPNESEWYYPHPLLTLNLVKP